MYWPLPLDIRADRNLHRGEASIGTSAKANDSIGAIRIQLVFLSGGTRQIKDNHGIAISEI